MAPYITAKFLEKLGKGDTSVFGIWAQPVKIIADILAAPKANCRLESSIFCITIRFSILNNNQSTRLLNVAKKYTLQNDNPRADRDTVIKINRVFIDHANATV